MLILLYSFFERELVLSIRRTILHSGVTFRHFPAVMPLMVAELHSDIELLLLHEDVFYVALPVKNCMHGASPVMVFSLASVKLSKHPLSYAADP